MTFGPWSKTSKEKSSNMEDNRSKKTCNLSKKTIGITFLVLGFIVIQSLTLGFWFMTYTTLNQERNEIAWLKERLAKMHNYETLFWPFNKDADKRLFEVTATTKG